jgi:hypothetical protein
MWRIKGVLYRFGRIFGAAGRGRHGWQNHALEEPAPTARPDHEIDCYAVALCDATPSTDTGWVIRNPEDSDICPGCARRVQSLLEDCGQRMYKKLT